MMNSDESLLGVNASISCQPSITWGSYSRGVPLQVFLVGFRPPCAYLAVCSFSGAGPE